MNEHDTDLERESPNKLEEFTSGSMVLARAEIDTQIATAKAYPRSLKEFMRAAKAMATLDEETAASCFYSLTREGKTIEGPSARFAEIIAVAWKNLRFGARVVSEDEKFLTAQGAAHDLESNIAITFEVRRRITTSAKFGKQARRYSDDMIVVTGNAAASIALRNAVLKVIPKAYWQPIYLEARKVAVGDARTLSSRRQMAFEYFAKLGVTTDRVLAVLERTGVEDVDTEDLVRLTGLKTAIKDGDTTIEEAFPEIVRTPPTGQHSLRNGHAPESPATPPDPATPTETQTQEPAPAAVPETPRPASFGGRGKVKAEF